MEGRVYYEGMLDCALENSNRIKRGTQDGLAEGKRQRTELRLPKAWPTFISVNKRKSHVHFFSAICPNRAGPESAALRSIRNSMSPAVLAQSIGLL